MAALAEQQPAAAQVGRAAGGWPLLLYVCFFVSGATALVYEVAWIRELTLVFGSTTFATSAILTAFMGGLALGGHLGGRWTSLDRLVEHLLQGYAVLEGFIGLYALLLPWLA